MLLKTTRTHEPMQMTGSFEITGADLIAAFDVPNPSPELQDLFYDVMGPKWLGLPVSERFSLLSKVAALVEAAATRLNVTAVVE